ncbi:hypothetical protein MKX01_038412 [Papaver californicum]|nr:hypothetical protein MKX01_038412 [Papaver californicum]
MSMAPAKMITLKCSDEQIFVIEEIIECNLKPLEHIIAGKETKNNVIPLTTITGSTLAKVIDYLNKHAEVRIPNYYDIMIQAASFLNIRGLLDLITPKVANMIIGDMWEIQQLKV